MRHYLGLSLSELFSKLEGLAPSRSSRTRTTTHLGVTNSSGDLLAGLGSDGLPRLLLPQKTSHPHGELEPVRGIDVYQVPLGDSRGGVVTYTEVACRAARFRLPFTTICQEIIEASRDSDQHPCVVVGCVLTRWKSFLARANPRRLTGIELQGLFGELVMLEHFLREKPDSLDNWRGPSGALHDFRCGDAAVEVKTTCSPSRTVVRINGLDQLDPAAAGGELFLAVIQLDHDDPEGDSVPTVIDRIVALLVDEELLGKKLQAIGYDERDREHYLKSRYKVRSANVYQVRDEFPRLAPTSSLSTTAQGRVSDVSYALDLTGLPVHFDVDPIEELTKLLLREETR